MKIYYENERLKSISIDRLRLAELLDAWGVSHEDMKRLRIYIQVRCKNTGSPWRTATGWYNGRSSVYVYTHTDMTPARLNRTLLHEIRHFMRHGYQPGEHHLPYTARPSNMMRLGLRPSLVISSSSSRFKQKRDRMWIL